MWVRRLSLPFCCEILGRTRKYSRAKAAASPTRRRTGLGIRREARRLLGVNAGGGAAHSAARPHRPPPCGGTRLMRFHACSRPGTSSMPAGHHVPPRVVPHLNIPKPLGKRLCLVAALRRSTICRVDKRSTRVYVVSRPERQRDSGPEVSRGTSFSQGCSPRQATCFPGLNRRSSRRPDDSMDVSEHSAALADPGPTLLALYGT